MGSRVALALVLVIAFGCSTVYTRPNTTREQQRVDYNECDRKARAIVRLDKTAQAEERAMAIVYLRKRCMEDLGYEIGGGDGNLANR